MNESDINRRVDERANPSSDAWAGVRHAEKQGSEPQAQPSFSDSVGYGPRLNTLRSGEDEGTGVNRIGQQQDQTKQKKGKESWRKRIMQKQKRKTGALAMIIALLFGGGGAMTMLIPPTLAPVAFAEVAKKALNDQLKAVDERSTILMSSKLDKATKGYCGVAVMPCKFANMSKKQVQNLEKTGKVKIERTPAIGPLGALGYSKPTKMTFYNDKGEVIGEANDGREFTRLRKSNIDARAALTEGYNPLYATMKDKLAAMKMRGLKVSFNNKITGETDEERQKSIDKAVSGVGDSGAKTLIPGKDKDGNEIYTDDRGNTYTKAEYDAIKTQAERIENRGKSGGVKGVYQTAMKGAGALAVGIGTMDTACTIFNTIRYSSSLAKTVQSAQAARFAQAMILTPADMIKAGEADEGSINFAANNLTSSMPPDTALDESRLSDPANAEKPATTSDPRAGKNAFDSPGYTSMAYGDTTTLSVEDSRFMIGGGNIAVVDAAMATVTRVLTLGNPDPKTISDKCRYVQNPAVRIGALAVGIAAGVGSFGVLTAVGIGSSVALSMALPLFEAKIADTLAGNAFKDISGYDTGIAGTVGSSVIFGSIAQGRGMTPVTNDEGIKYLNDSQHTYQAHVDTERYIARGTPLDINNPHSFLGSIAISLVPTIERSKTSAGAAMINVASLIPLSLGHLSSTANAAVVDDGYKREYFEKCNDPALNGIGIKAGQFCEPHFYMKKSQLEMDPVENAQWMVDNGEIDPLSETGEAKDNGREWNYAKYMKECPNRTMGWGENQEENGGNGWNCIDPAKAALNDRYGVFTMDKSLQDSMDNNLGPSKKPGLSGTPSDDKNEVSPDGWAFPTDKTNVIIKRYRPADDPNHQGIRLAATSQEQTRGQTIFAARDGKVIAVGPSRDYCNWIVLSHDVEGKTMTTVYGNLTADGINVEFGQNVKAGDPIGKLGVDSGENRCVKEAYLYFELWQGSTLLNGIRLDPTPTVEAARKATTGESPR